MYTQQPKQQTKKSPFFRPLPPSHEKPSVKKQFPQTARQQIHNPFNYFLMSGTGQESFSPTGRRPFNPTAVFMQSPRSSAGSDRSTSSGFSVGGPSHLHDWPLGRSATHERYIKPVPPMYVTEYEASYVWPKTVPKRNGSTVASKPVPQPSKTTPWKELEQAVEELVELERKYPAISQVYCNDYDTREIKESENALTYILLTDSLVIYRFSSHLFFHSILSSSSYDYFLSMTGTDSSGRAYQTAGARTLARREHRESIQTLQGKASTYSLNKPINAPPSHWTPQCTYILYIPFLSTHTRTIHSNQCTLSTYILPTLQAKLDHSKRREDDGSEESKHEEGVAEEKKDGDGEAAKGEGVRGVNGRGKGTGTGTTLPQPQPRAQVHKEKVKAKSVPTNGAGRSGQKGGTPQGVQKGEKQIHGVQKDGTPHGVQKDGTKGGGPLIPHVHDHRIIDEFREKMEKFCNSVESLKRGETGRTPVK